MNTKVTFPELVDALAGATNTPKRVCEIFLKELFGLVGDTLIAGENVKIKHLGTFKLIQVEARKSVNVNTGEEIEIPSHNKVSFTPDKELAEAINQPFSGFETVILSDDMPDEEMDRLTSTDEIEIPVENPEDSEYTEEQIIEERAEEPVINESVQENNDSGIEEVVVEPTGIGEECDDTDNQMAANSYKEDVMNEMDDTRQSDDSGDPEVNDESEKETYHNIEDKNYISGEELESSNGHNGSFKRGFLWGFITALLVSLGTFIVVSLVVGFPLSYHETSDTIRTNDTVKSENNAIRQRAVSAPVKNDTVIDTYKPAIEVKRDTISKTRFLTTMAREYYGNYNFWVYIYEENRNIIDNPNKIKPGTAIVIPDAGKYGINKDDPQSLQTAKQKAFEIFKQYE